MKQLSHIQSEDIKCTDLYEQAKREKQENRLLHHTSNSEANAYLLQPRKLKTLVRLPDRYLKQDSPPFLVACKEDLMECEQKLGRFGEILTEFE